MPSDPGDIGSRHGCSRYPQHHGAALVGHASRFADLQAPSPLVGAAPIHEREFTTSINSAAEPP
jgi:hypothetical protein